MADSPLARFADAMASALLQNARDPMPTAIAHLAGQPGFAVYRNTVMKGCVDALQANYPAVAGLVGAEWFRAAATLYVRANPPTHPALVLYGERFAAFLHDFAPARALPYLPDVARLDRLWTEAHVARDDGVLGANAPRLGDGPALAQARVQPHAAARWAWIDMPVVTLWWRNRELAANGDEPLVWDGEGALLTRPRGQVQVFALRAGGVAFLDACATGGTLGEAGAAALESDPDCDLAILFADLVGAGALAPIAGSPRVTVELCA